LKRLCSFATTYVFSPPNPRSRVSDGQTYAQTGSLEFSDVTVNVSTSTVTIRGTVPNPGIGLLPGMFVRARLEEGANPNGILVPQSSVTRNTKGDAVAMVVGVEQKVEPRVLETSRSVGNRWLVTAGLKPGDQLIVNNLQRIQPGMLVKPQPISPHNVTGASGTPANSAPATSAPANAR